MDVGADCTAADLLNYPDTVVRINYFVAYLEVQLTIHKHPGWDSAGERQTKNIISFLMIFSNIHGLLGQAEQKIIQLCNVYAGLTYSHGKVYNYGFTASPNSRKEYSSIGHA